MKRVTKKPMFAVVSTISGRLRPRRGAQRFHEDLGVVQMLDHIEHEDLVELRDSHRETRCASRSQRLSSTFGAGDVAGTY